MRTEAASTHAMHVVLVEKFYPFPANHGRVARLVSVARALAQNGFKVTILSPPGAGPQKFDEPFEVRTCKSPRGLLRDLSLWRLLRKVHKEYPVDVVQVENSLLFPFFKLAKASGFRVFFEAHIVERDFWRVSTKDSLITKGAARALPAAERAMALQADHVIALSEADKSSLCGHYGIPVDHVSVLPLWIDDRLVLEGLPGQSVPLSALFLGAYNHSANQDAIKYLLDDIAPRLWALEPQATLHLVGRGIPVGLARDPRVKISADVPDVAGPLDGAAVCIAPIRVGSGLRTKVLEYWARARPVVATPAAMEGLDANDRDNVLVAADADGIARSIVELFRNPELASRLGSQGRARIESRHRASLMIPRLVEVYVRYAKGP